MIYSLLEVSFVLQKLSLEGASHHLHLLFCKSVYTDRYISENDGIVLNQVSKK